MKLTAFTNAIPHFPQYLLDTTRLDLALDDVGNQTEPCLIAEILLHCLLSNL